MPVKKVETSKIIVAFVGAVVFVVTAFSMFMVYDTKNTEPLSVLIPAVFGAFATAMGFYFNKAKRENEIKLRKKYGSEIYNDVKGDSYDSENY
jgi:CDP-diglyceride synthetase